MLLPAILSCALAAALAAPAFYDERQDGDFNVRADVKNVLLIVAVPKRSNRPPPSLLDFVSFDNLLRKPGDVPETESESEDGPPGMGSREPQLQERADVQVMEAFVEPSTPYRVEIGAEGERYAEGDGRAAEVVIAGRRRASPEAAEGDEIKLLGATEQCGPDRERDPVTLTCRARSSPVEDSPPKVHEDKVSAVQPEVVPASSLI